MTAESTVVLAWRNLLRNPRRSLLTVSTISVGLAAVMFGQSLLRSFQRQMIEKSTGIMHGHVQVQARDATDRKVPGRLLREPERFRKILEGDPRVEVVGIRLLYTGLVSSAMSSRGVLVAGIEPERELRLSILPRYLKKGRFLGKSPRDIVLGAKLASDLDARLGERLVVMAQSLEGDMNSELFRVAGLFETGSTIFDGQVVYVPLEPAQRIRGRPGHASNVVARLKEVDQIDRLVADRAGELGDPDAVLLTYRETGAEVAGIKRFQDALLIVVLIIIFSIVGLGILNTISMSFYERIREFGVIRALGARPRVIFGLLITEASIMGIIGAVLGFSLGLGVIGIFGVYGLELPLGEAMSYFMPFDNVIFMQPIWEMHLWSALGVFLVTVGAAIGPAVRASRLVVAYALRYV
ncbi:ABC transporter permease [Elusimicrobiota bacterium]